MKTYHVIDADGIWIDEIRADEQAESSWVVEAIPNNVYAKVGVSPRWDGAQWLTSATPEPDTPDLTVESRLDNLEAVMLFLI